MSSLDNDIDLSFREKGDVNLGSIHDETTARHPGRTALIDGETGEKITYDSLAKNVASAGNALNNLGVESGDRVALCFQNQFMFIYSFFGAARIGAVPVPVNVQTTQAKFRSIVADSDASVVVSSGDTEILSKVEMVVEPINTVDTVAIDTGEPRDIKSVKALSFITQMDRASSTLSPAPTEPDDAAMQPYTSGSTGTPKGVVLTHSGCQWMIDCIHTVHFLTSQDRAIIAGPLYHKNAMVGAVKPMLSVGGSVVVMSGFDAPDVIEAIEQYKVTYIRGVPAMYKMLIAADAIDNHDMSTVEWAVSGSASLSKSLIKNVRKKFGCNMGEAYGLTETGGPVSLSPRWGPKKLNSAGLTLPGAHITIIDPESRTERDLNETGELVVSCPGNGSYYRRPEKEAEAYFELNGRRYLRTGDLAFQDEQGYNYILGRIDNMIIVGGENVYPADVENLLQSHEAVEDVAVVSAPHEIKNEAPVAFVTAEGVNEVDLKQYALDNGPAYAHPRRVFLKSELPLASTGKIDRDVLEEEAIERIEGGEL